MKKFAGLLLSVLTIHGSLAAAQESFALKGGNKVLFYGDSITDLRDYTTIIETFVATRYPGLDASFVNSGWGGDTVRGGGGGPVDTRLERDLFAYQPDVVTIMLGMNDGGYKAETVSTDQAYFAGYKHIVESIHHKLPQAQIFAIQPSPYDDVTRPPAFPVSGDVLYNDVLRSFGKWIDANAQELGVVPIDANTSFVQALKRAQDLDPANAKQILADHVHPSFGGSLILAQSILKAWKARPLVSEITLDAGHNTLKIKSSQFTTATPAASGLAWTQLDQSLPLPFKQWTEMWGGGAPVELAIRSADLYQALNRQMVRVLNLPNGTYSLNIDGASVGAFNNDQLAEGVNLAALKTPATDQAMKVFQLAKSHEEIHYDRWRNIDVPLAEYHLPESSPASKALDQLDDAVARKMRTTAQPVSHTFEMVPISAK